MLAKVEDNGVVTVRGDKNHPANYGRLCSKGTALAETVYHEDRLLYPEIDTVQVSWEQALRTVAGEFGKIAAKYGSDAVAFYVSGQLLTEDYYVANKLMKGFIGSANIDTNSRLCMSSPVMAHKRAFGEDLVPGCYEDIERARMIVLVGTNTAWCHPVLYQRIVKAKKDNPDLFIVLLDPRKTQTAGIADLHLDLAPGTDAVLLSGLLAYLETDSERNILFTENFTTGLESALAAAQKTAPSLKTVAQKCRLDEQDVLAFYRQFSRTERVVSLFSQGVNQSRSGTDNGNALINCHLFTGRIGRPGMGVFSLTGQPNAMGGREVGGLATMLAAHMEIDNAKHGHLVQRFWNSPHIASKPGAKAVDLFQKIESGKIRAVWIMGTNPVVSMPEANRVRKALEKCPLVVVSDCVRNTDTVDMARIRLPALTWGERNGTLTNSERCITRQRPFLPIPGLARPDWQIISDVARYMGFEDAFPYQKPAEIFREHAALSGFGNNGDRAFDISELSHLSDTEYDALQPIQWPVTPFSPHGTKRLFSDGRYYTPDQKAHFITIKPCSQKTKTSSDFPFILNTGRVRDQWHTMTRTGMSPRLSSHIVEPFVEIHPDDCHACNVTDGGLAKVSSPYGHVIVRVVSSADQKKGCLFVPMHWNDHFSARARVGTLVQAVTDPVSGQPDFKHYVANISAYDPEWYGFILSRRQLGLTNPHYWVRSRAKGVWRYHIAGDMMADNWASSARKMLCSKNSDVNWIEYFDCDAKKYRGARMISDQIESCVFINESAKMPAMDWLVSLFQKESLSQIERKALLSGQSPVAEEDRGRIVCSCFDIGEKTIRAAIKEHCITSTKHIGEILQAGTNCGSCLPELGGILESMKGIQSR